MTIKPIPSTQIGASPKPKIVTDPNDKLGKDDFLRLLLEQLKNQNPTQPMADRDFIVQLAQFRTLEQQQQMNTSLQTLLDFQHISLASTMIGKSVEATVNGRTVTGTVSDVRVKSNQVLLTVNGAEVDLSDVTLIRAPSANAGTNQG